MNKLPSLHWLDDWTVKCNEFTFEISQISRGNWVYKLVRDNENNPVHEYPFGENLPFKDMILDLKHFAQTCYHTKEYGWVN